MMYKFIKSGVPGGLGYLKGQEADLTKKDANRLIKGGYCIAVATPKVVKIAPEKSKSTSKK